MAIRICLVDETKRIKADVLGSVAAAVRKQIRAHFAAPPPLGYGFTATVRAMKPGETPDNEDWVCALLPVPDQADALGYHDETPSGRPLMKVFPFLEPTQPWSITVSHEILECLADPNLAKAAQAPDGVFWAYEICDAVEDQSYDVEGVKVSDFVFPSYFEPPPKLDGVKFDHLDLVKRPLEILEGGYGQAWNPNEGWVQYGSPAGATSAYRRKLAEMGLGRGKRRARGASGARRP